MAYSKQNFQNGQILNAANLEAMENGIIAGQGAYNLLDNSDFTNPVNSQGQTSYTGAGDTIDRWKAGVSDCSMYVNAGKSVAFNTKTEGVNAYWRQYLPHSLSQLEGKTFTLAIKDTWGNIHCASGVYPTSAPSDTKSVIWINMYENVSIVLYCAKDGTAFVQLTTKKSVPISWVALYEGSYTADTLPSYVPKGKHVEMLNCNVPLAPHNLLDNSDFINAINYSGATSWTTHGVYCIDRWKTESANNAANISYTKGSGITLTPSSTNYAGIIQQFENYSSMTGKVYTIAICVNNVWYSGTFTMGATPSGGVVLSNGIRIYSASGYNVLIRNPARQSAITIQRAALYEGSYTAETLPPYVPKDKHVEMLNCGVPLAPHNLLDNSDFTNPVNQRGATTTSQYKYFLDRWIARLSDISLAVGNSGLTLTSSATANIFIYQKLSAGKALNGKTVTVAVCDGTGNVATTTTNLPTTNATSWTSYAVAQTNNGVYASVIDLGSGDYPIAVRVGVQSDALNKTIRWAALYEGSYDASTLPSYQPKGYAAELAECQRYYRTMGFPVIPCANNPAGTQVYGFLPFRMRIDNPTVSYDTLYYFKGETTFYTVSSASAESYGAGTRIIFNLSSNVEGNLAGAVAGIGITLNADL